jgi:adenylate cyclase
MILNEHFTVSTRSITSNHGIVNKFIGDAIMAIFEEPPAYHDDSASRRALSAGLDMISRFDENVRSWTGRVTKPVSFGLGVGVHTGQVILGNIGSSERMEFTAIGDTVNTTSRLCSMAKNGQLVASQECFELAHQWFEAEAQEPVKLKGKTGLYTTYVVKHRIINR